MEVENAGEPLARMLHIFRRLYLLSRVGLTSWWTTEQERHLTVGDGLLLGN